MAIRLIDLYRQTLARLSGERLVADALARAGSFPRLRLLGLGKASSAMARGAARALGEVSGVVATNSGSPVPTRVRFLQGGHPVPDASSETAGRALLAEASSLTGDDAAVFLVSGGGSAIAVVPSAGLTLADKIATTRALLRAGVPIEQMNAVRKHLSALKGGQLAAACLARRRFALVLCDVPTGDLASVASGPTTGDPTTFADCLAIVAGAHVDLPARALAHLRAGAHGEIPETPKPGDLRLANLEHVLLASPMDLARTAATLAGEPCLVESSPIACTVSELAERIEAAVRSEGGPSLFAWSGEPRLRVPARSGSGGRMQHLALMLARQLSGYGFEALCAGSDGRDGDTPHAGALVDGQTAVKALSVGVDLEAPLGRFNSADACASIGAALPAFDSETNLCDLVLVRRG
jgi:hydroxypyruvate reductase